MKYNQPYGVSDPDGPYINGNPSTGTMGSIPPAASIEYPQREIVNFIGHSRIVPDNGDLHQLAKAVQSGQVIFAIDSGPVNNLAVGMNPPLLAYPDGIAVWVRVNITNTAGATVSINGLPPKNIVRRGGSPLQAGDLPGGYAALLNYSELHNNFELYGTNYTAQTGLLFLAANTTLYVNTSTGSDTLYDGTAATVDAPHGPFKTISRAMTETFKYGPSVYTMTIMVAAGTYNEAVYTAPVTGPTVIIRGAGKTMTIVTGADNSHTFNVGNANTMILEDICSTAVRSGSGPPCCFSAYGSGRLSVNNTASGSAPNCYVFSAYGGEIYINNHTFNAGSQALCGITSFFGGFVMISPGRLLEHQSGCNFPQGYISASTNGTVGWGIPYPIFSNPGNVTGYRYVAGLNGVVSTQGFPASSIPGNQNGILNSGGQYG